uniref:MFS domain-containing protein n=1 Tax=Rhabditophanes sp. KR3021 TaxID=114890 RepID=A0AC35TM34_9BILA
MGNIKLLTIGFTLAICSIFQMGYNNAYVNTATEEFKRLLNESFKDRHVSMSESIYYWTWSAILNTWFVGFAMGSCLAIPISNKLGRKSGLLVSNMGTIMSVAVMAVSIPILSLELLALGRFMSAVSSGIAMSSLVVFLQEISPLHLRGSMSFFAELAFVVTNACGSFAGMPIILGKNLVILIAFAALPPLVAIFLLVAIYETPIFLFAIKHNQTDAIKSLQFYQRIITKEDCLTFLNGNSGEQSETSFWTLIKELFQIPHLRKGLLLGFFALQITCSIWAIIFYSTDFLIKSNISSSLAIIFSTIMLGVSVAATIIGFFVVEKFSRRKMFLYVSAINLLALTLFWAFDQARIIFDADFMKYFLVFALFLHGVTYSIATGPIAWFLVSELIPLPHRLLAQSLSLCANSVSALILTLIVLPLYNAIGSHTILILLVLPAIACMYYLYKELPETRDKTPNEVVLALKKQTNYVDSIELK